MPVCFATNELRIVQSGEITKCAADVRPPEPGVEELFKFVRQVVENEIFRIAMMTEDFDRKRIV